MKKPSPACVASSIRGTMGGHFMTHMGRILAIATMLLHVFWPSLANAQACPHQGLASFGPVTPATFDYPAYYVDQNALGLAACQDPADPICAVVTGPLPNPAAPADIAAGNFFAEFPYTFINATVPMPGGGIGLLVYSVLGTFAPVGDVVPGTQVVFSRVRFRIDTPAAGTYTMTHPFGVTTLTAAAPGRRSINFTNDCLLRVPPTCGIGFNTFTTPLDPSSFISTWLRWDATPPAPPAGAIGDFVIPHPITGSPCGTNFFRVEGPGLPPGGVQTNLFNLMGKKASICGNGVVEPGEQCDDGNTLDGDCCSSTCQFDPAGAPCTGTNVCLTATTCNGAGVCGGGTPTLSACNDGNVCTVADTCFNGACVGVPNTCDDANVCTTDFCTPPTVGDSCSGSKCMGFTRDAKLTLIAGENPSLSAAFPAAGDARTNGTSVRVSLINMD